MITTGAMILMLVRKRHSLNCSLAVEDKAQTHCNSFFWNIHSNGFTILCSHVPNAREFYYKTRQVPHRHHPCREPSVMHGCKHEGSHQEPYLLWMISGTFSPSLLFFVWDLQAAVSLYSM